MSNQQWNGYTPASGGQQPSNHQRQHSGGGGSSRPPRFFPPSVQRQPQRPPFSPPQQHQYPFHPRPPPPSQPLSQVHSGYRPYPPSRPPNGYQRPPPPPPPPLASPPPPPPNFQDHSPSYPHSTPYNPFPGAHPSLGFGALPLKPLPPTLNSNGKRSISELVVGEASPPLPPPSQKRRWSYKLPPQLPPPVHIIWDGEEIISDLPPIPPLDEPLFSQVFTHTSLKGTSKQVFEEPESTGPIGDYERLEHLGDSVLGFIVAELIGDLFPRLTVGCASELRSNMVNNTTALPAFATAYHLHTQLRASQSQRLILMIQKGCRSQLFEAYLAGIFRQYGYPLLRTWLRDILTPVAYLAHASLKKQKLAPPPPVLGPVASNVGFTALLNQWGYDSRRSVEYVDSSDSVVRGPTQKHKLYEFSVRVGKHEDPRIGQTIYGPSLVVEGVGSVSLKDKDAGVEKGAKREWTPLEDEEGEVAGLLLEGGEESLKDEVDGKEADDWLIFGPSQASKKAAAKNNCAWAACIALGIVAKTS